MRKKIILGLFVMGLSLGVAGVFSGCAPQVTTAPENQPLPSPCGFAYNSCMPPQGNNVSTVKSAQPKPAVTSEPSYLQEYPWLSQYNIQSNSNNILFAFNKYDLTSTDEAILKKDAIYLRYNPDISVQIQGNCDRIGSEEYNLALGWRRANTVKIYLENLGVDAGRLHTISYGKEKPLCSAHTSSCDAINRRVHFAVIMN